MFKSVFCLCTVALFGFLVVPACASSANESPTWTATPSSIFQQKGTYPSALVLRLFFNKCFDSNGNAANALTGTPADFSVVVTGVPVKVTINNVDTCSLTVTMDASAAQPGVQAINIMKGSKGQGFASIGFMDGLAGPTPDKPEVDVMWEVLTDHLCSDNFGNHITKDLFCIDVKLGNNSGHSLQLAGLGFQRENLFCVDSEHKRISCSPELGDIRTPNVAYQAVRASAQNSSSFTGRNLLVNGMQAVGLLMASFTPFFENTFNKSRWSTGATIVGTTLPQVANRISPDLTLPELNNLDDQAFRDGKLIPNNTQVRLLVFIQKKSITEAISDVVQKIQDATMENCKTPMKIGYKQVPGDSTRCYPAWEDSFKECRKNLKCSPLVVKLALGRLVIVGNTIDFIQRIVVDSRVTSQEVPVPTTVQSAAVSGTTLTVLGTNLLPSVDKLLLTCSDASGNSIQTDMTAKIDQKTSGMGQINAAIPSTIDTSRGCTVTLNTKSGETQSVITTPQQ